MNLVLYQPDIAANVGAMIRMAACLGVNLHIIEPCGFPFNMRKIKIAAMDYIDLVDLKRHNSWEDFQEFIKNEDGNLVLLTTKASKNYLDYQFQKNDFLMLGRESSGVPSDVAEICDARVKINMAQGRSLNIVTAAAIILGEGLRQISL